MFEQNLESAVSPASLFRSLPKQPGRILLEEQGAAGGRRVLIGYCPHAYLEWRGQRGFMRRRDGGTERCVDFVVGLRNLNRALTEAPVPSSNGEFVGGLLGYLGYDLRGLFETLPDANPIDSSLPDSYFGAYDHWLVYDESHRDPWTFRALNIGEEIEPKLRAAREFLRAAETIEIPELPELPRYAVSNLTRGDYLQAIERIRELILAGEVYQVNFTQRFLLELEAEPIVVFERIRRLHPATFAALVEYGSAAISCHSPESFLEVSGKRVKTQPIKGTIARSADPVEDLQRAVTLASSAKDRAELAMIVDLMRNDLSRVCRPGSVKVRKHAHLESAPTVHHLVTSVEGELEPQFDVYDLIAKAWPGGSITGAPKIRAMQIIDELETIKRGPYTGSIGRIGLDGTARLSIAIRSLVLEGGYARVHGGGGIVVDSDPETEYAESVVKVQGLLDALNAEIVD